jgi:hypothetical protein
MSNLTLFQDGSTLPAHVRKGELSAITKALMGTSNKRISIEGGAFRLIVGGQEVSVSEDRGMNMIVVRSAENNTRTFYPGTYVKGAKAKPACWSDDSKVPHADVKLPQSANCATCPQNVKGSGTTNESRACRFQRRLAVVLENDINGDIYAMSIPAASLFDNGEGRKMGLQQYARFLGGHGADINAVVTEMRFDMNATAPKLTFSAVRPLEVAEFATVEAKYNDPSAIDAITMTVSQLDGDATPAAPAPAPVAPAPAPVAAKPTPKATPTPKAAPFAVAKNVEMPVEEPKVRASEAPTTVPPATADKLNAMVSDWGDDIDD